VAFTDGRVAALDREEDIGAARRTARVAGTCGLSYRCGRGAGELAEDGTVTSSAVPLQLVQQEEGEVEDGNRWTFFVRFE
jgi:hypothetical protein